MKQQIDIAIVLGIKRELERELSYERTQDIKEYIGEWAKR